MKTTEIKIIGTLFLVWWRLRVFNILETLALFK
jgi:hypothetical protein